MFSVNSKQCELVWKWRVLNRLDWSERMRTDPSQDSLIVYLIRALKTDYSDTEQDIFTLFKWKCHILANHLGVNPYRQNKKSAKSVLTSSLSRSTWQRDHSRFLSDDSNDHSWALGDYGQSRGSNKFDCQLSII